MFCQNCGTVLNAGVACQCGYDPMNAAHTAHGHTPHTHATQEYLEHPAHPHAATYPEQPTHPHPGAHPAHHTHPHPSANPVHPAYPQSHTAHPEHTEHPPHAHYGGYPPPPNYGRTTNDFIQTITAKFSINQLAMMGGCALLLILLFLPFLTVNMGILGRSSTSGFSMIFGSAGSLGGFLNFLLPVIGVVAFQFVKLAESKTIVLGVAFLGAYINLASMLGSHSQMTSAGVGMVLSFLIWLAIVAAAFMEYRGINLLNDLVKK